MTLVKDNSIFDKTSFLQGGDNLFIKELYLKYLNNPEKYLRVGGIFLMV